METIFDYIKTIEKEQKEYDKLSEETEDNKWTDYFDQSRYAIEYLEDSYQRLQEYKNWKIDNETPITKPKVILEEPKVIVEEKPKINEDNRPVVKYQDQEKIDIKTLLKVGAIFDNEKYYRDKKERDIFYITKLTDKTVYYKKCNEIKIRNSSSHYGGYENYKVMLGKDGKNEEHKMLIKKLRPNDFFDDDGKVYDFNFQVPRQFDYGH
jgi:hypothetical protein